MNRLHHIKKTVKRNLESNKDYGDLEVVLLDYNSSDNLEEWVLENMNNEIRMGQLIFKRTDVPKRFHRSHARNMAFQLATGDIVCNIDADNYTGPFFAAYVNRHFHKNAKSFLSVNYQDTFNNIADTFGRIACFKNDFEKVGGFDERMLGYGYEDIDLCNRLKLLGRKQCFIENKKYLNAIEHDETDRFKNEPMVAIKTAYISYLSPFRSRILLLMKDGSYSYGSLEDFNRGLGTPTLEENNWTRGHYQIGRDEVTVVGLSNLPLNFNLNQSTISDKDGEIYYRIIDKRFLNKLEVHYTIISNHQILVNNLESGRIKVNS